MMIITKKKKKAMSAIVATMILLLLVVSVTAVIWVIINKTVKENLEGAKSCYDVIGKVEFNSEYI